MQVHPKSYLSSACSVDASFLFGRRPPRFSSSGSGDLYRQGSLDSRSRNALGVLDIRETLSDGFGRLHRAIKKVLMREMADRAGGKRGQGLNKGLLPAASLS